MIEAYWTFVLLELLPHHLIWDWFDQILNWCDVNRKQFLLKIVWGFWFDGKVKLERQINFIINVNHKLNQ